eukprot:937812_1
MEIYCDEWHCTLKLLWRAMQSELMKSEPHQYPLSKHTMSKTYDSSGLIMPPPSQQQQQMTPTEIASTMDGILTLFFPDLSRYMSVNNPQPQEQEGTYKTDDEAEEEFDLLRFETTYLSGENFEYGTIAVVYSKTHLEKIE